MMLVINYIQVLIYNKNIWVLLRGSEHDDFDIHVEATLSLSCCRRFAPRAPAS